MKTAKLFQILFLKYLPFFTLLLTLTGCEPPPESFPALPQTQDIQVSTSDLLTVHFLDVGQADAALLIQGDAAMLIDGGNVADSDLIYAYLTDQGIEKLDYIVCTHAHEDHVGGLSAALANFPVDMVFSPVTEYDSNAFRNFLKYTEEQGLEITPPEPITTYRLGDASFTILGPLQDYEDDPNNSSIVLRLDFGEISFLFTGDMEEESEQDHVTQGMPLDVDVLKVGHHGSNTSSQDFFLDQVTPTYAIISCELDGSYGHPHEEVLARLQAQNVALYRTDLQGHIIATTDGKSIQFTTEKNSDIVTNPTEITPNTTEIEESEDLDESIVSEELEESKESIVPEKSEESVISEQYTSIYIGNINSKVFHLETCNSLPQEQNQTFFKTREDALLESFTPCGRCNP